MQSTNSPMLRLNNWAAIALMSLACSGPLRGQSVPAPAVGEREFSIAVIPDPQGYTQSYDVRKGGEKWAGRGYPYKERFKQQVRWIVDNRDARNIRLAVDLGDNVQHFGYDATKADDPASIDAKIRGEWLNAQNALNLFHRGGDPAQPALVPYAIAAGNHDYHFGNPGDLDSREFERFLGPGRWRDDKGDIRGPFADWFKGDDKGWAYRVDGEVVATGVGRNSAQTFSAGGLAFLHLTLECAPTDQALAWAEAVLKDNPGKPTILTTHTFINGAGEFVAADKMGRYVKGGRNPTNASQAIFDKLISRHDQIFMVLCGHSYSQKHVVLKNKTGRDVHVLEACYHLQYDGGRIRMAEKPQAGWAYKGEADDLDRNGCGWLRLIVFDAEHGRIRLHTYSPTLGLWAGNRKGTPHSQPDGQDGVWWNRTFPIGEDVSAEFAFNFRERFGRPTTGPDTR